MQPRAHWDSVWANKNPREVSWFQTSADVSMQMLDRTGLEPNAKLVDVGGGAGALVPALLEKAFTDITVVDISPHALERAKAVLMEDAKRVSWHVADVTESVPGGPYALWHDRAVFHFLTEPERQAAYVRVLREALALDGHVIIATFAPDGPDQCSGLPVAKHDAPSIARVLGPGFALQETLQEVHQTPWRTEQRFVYTRFKRVS